MKGNEVRVGGFRVGVVEDIKPKLTTVNGERRSVAVAELNLDKKIEPLSRDTQFRVRPRSALGLKYIELSPARARPPAVRRHGPGRAVLRAASSSRTSSHLRPRDPPDIAAGALDGFGNAFAGRGQAINRSIPALNPFFKAPDTGDAEPVRSGHRARPVLPPDGPGVRAGGAGAEMQALAVHRHGGHVRGDLRQPARAPGHDREGRADDGRLDPLLPSAAAVHGRLHRPLGSAAARGGAAAALAPAINSAFRGRHAGAAADGGAERQPEKAFNEATTCSRTRTRCPP